MPGSALPCSAQCMDRSTGFGSRLCYAAHRLASLDRAPRCIVIESLGRSKAEAVAVPIEAPQSQAKLCAALLSVGFESLDRFQAEALRFQARHR